MTPTSLKISNPTEAGMLSGNMRLLQTKFRSFQEFNIKVKHILYKKIIGVSRSLNQFQEAYEHMYNIFVTQRPDLRGLQSHA